jgi:hypothetical protein
MMPSQTQVVDIQPLKTLNGANVVVELFADRLIIRRTDTLTTLLPDMFEKARTIDLNDIAAVYLHESKYIYSQWLMMYLQLTNHKHIVLLYSRKEYPQAQAVKNMIDDVISRREPSPAVTV